MTRRGLTPLFALVGLVATLAFCDAGQAQASCTSAVLQDWRDGRIDGTYSVECYRTTLAQLPEDLRIYSSAESDIERALLTRTKRTVAAPVKPEAAKSASSKRGGSDGLSPLLVLAITGLILAALGSAFALAR